MTNASLGVFSASTIYDGTGNDAFSGHVVVRDGIIEAVVRTGVGGAPAGGLTHELDTIDARTVVADGAALCPGFIDMHSHSDLSLLTNAHAPSKLAQGVTTEVVGNCGFSAFPEPTYWLEPMAKYGEAACFERAHDYLTALDRHARASNVATLVGAGSVRARVTGASSSRPPTADELERMAGLVRDAVDDGALGISTGAFYRPGCYAAAAEVAVLVAAAAERGGRFFATHLRDEGPALLSSALEAIDIARRAEVALHISHLKSKGTRTWGSLQYTLACIEDSDVPVTVDFYPYTASMSSIDSLIPREVFPLLDQGVMSPEIRSAIIAAIRHGVLAHDGDDMWDRIVLAHVPGRPDVERLTLGAAAAQLGVPPEEAVLDITLLSDGRAEVINHCMSQQDVDLLASISFAAVASDGYALPADVMTLVHPRSFGTFPEFVRRYVVETKSLSLSEAVRKMTSMPADLVGLSSVGRIAPGARADFVALRLDTLRSASTYEVPAVLPEGFELLVVGGEQMTLDAVGVAEPAGRVLYR